jgi:hypothetical protein
MSIKSITQRPLSLFSLGQPPQGPGFAPPKPPVQPAGTPLGENPFRQAKLNTQQQHFPVDQLGQFMNLMQGGMIKPDLNKPALPHTASKSWSA